MTALSTYLIAAGGALVALLAAWLTGRRSGATTERNANRAKEADAYEKELNDIKVATDARNSVRPVDPDSLPDAKTDPYRRD